LCLRLIIFNLHIHRTVYPLDYSLTNRQTAGPATKEEWEVAEEGQPPVFGCFLAAVFVVRVQLFL
jgi:hypothetical protein